MKLGFLKQNIDNILSNTISGILVILIVALFSAAILLTIEYTSFKIKVDSHEKKIDSLETNFNNFLQRNFDADPEISKKVDSEKLAKLVLENKISPSALSSMLDITKANDLPLARKKILEQGYLKPHQLNKLFKPDYASSENGVKKAN